MKIYLVTAATLVLFVMFVLFQTDNDIYLQTQEQIKSVANDAADAAVLLYEPDAFADGLVCFNKIEGMKVIKDIIISGMKVDDSFAFDVDNPYLSGTLEYSAYFFDEDGKLVVYENGRLDREVDISFPFNFEEPTTHFAVAVTEPTVIVTINAGTFDFRLAVIPDPPAIRTSSFEDALSFI